MTRSGPTDHVDPPEGVVLVPWPGPPAPLAGEGGPGHLYLVAPDHPAPDVAGCLEDWVRLPAAQEDIAARARALAARAAAHRLERERPEVDDVGVIRVGGRWAELPPIEARIVAALIDRFGRPVRTEQLLRTGWDTAEPSPTALRVHMVRLRRRLQPLGLRIGNVAGRGYLLEHDTARAPGAVSAPGGPKPGSEA